LADKTALGDILREEDRGELSQEMQAMKDLLRSKGAKTYDERWKEGEATEHIQRNHIDEEAEAQPDKAAAPRRFLPLRQTPPHRSQCLKRRSNQEL
jgi:hypothetical protein